MAEFILADGGDFGGLGEIVPVCKFCIRGDILGCADNDYIAYERTIGIGVAAMVYLGRRILVCGCGNGRSGKERTYCMMLSPKCLLSQSVLPSWL